MAGSGGNGIEDAHERRRRLGRLRRLAARLDHQALLIRNGGFDPRAEARAGQVSDDARALRWALAHLAPETECVGQVFAVFESFGSPGRAGSPV